MRRILVAAVILGTLAMAPWRAEAQAQGPSFTYHGGPVMGRSTTYAVFWLPAGQHFEPAGDDARFESRIRSFLGDVGGTPYYKVLTEYSKSRKSKVKGGPIRNASTFGGSYLDTTPYGHDGSTGDPLPAAGFRDAVTRAIQANGWTAGPTSVFFVYTAANVQVCGFPIRLPPGIPQTQVCTFQSASTFATCSATDSFKLGSRTVLYGMLAVSSAMCALDPAVSPIGDSHADAMVAETDALLVNAVTDPLGNAWNFGSRFLGIASPCDGDRVSLQGHAYFLPDLWSKAAKRCVNSRPPKPATPELFDSQVDYHTGSVMPTTTTYAIYWLPAGAHFETGEPGGSDARYQSLVNRFLQDVGGTSYYNVLTQYSKDAKGRTVANGPIQNSSTFGGAVVDTNPYPHAGTTSNPLFDYDISAEVTRVMRANGWTLGLNKLYFIFTAANVNICFAASLGASCTFGQNGSPASFCGYHSFVPVDEQVAVFAVEPDIGSLEGCQVYAPFPLLSPNDDSWFDAQTLVMSHELVESVTDPLGFGWRASLANASGSEIGDLCLGNTDNGPSSDGANVTLHDHRYYVQAIFSNVDHQCAFD
jgi:hypothetical protein